MGSIARTKASAEGSTCCSSSERSPGALDGSSLRFESAAPLQEVARLVERGLRFDALSIQQPDLESVFLALTGRRLRDD